MKEPLFKGVCTALITPFLDGKINYPMMEQLLKRQIEAGIRAVVIAGTTGESSTLTDDEKIALCKAVVNAGADFIKTSTGFSTGGATFHDVELFAKYTEGKCKIKAAGGIRTRNDMEKFIYLGADRLGTSSAIKILNSEKTNDAY